MPPHFRSSLVNFQNIDFQDASNSLTPEGAQEPDPALLTSVARTGILHPPILREQGSARLQIVAGRRRLLAAAASRQAASAICLLLPAASSAAEALSCSLEETVLRGNITMAEQAIFFHKALTLMDEETACRFLPVLGLGPHPHHIRKLLKLLQLEEHLLLSLHRGFLQEGAAQDLLLLSFIDRMSLFELMELLRLSASNQRKLTAVCRELAGRTNTPIMALLGRGEVRAILSDPDSNVPQKTAQLMQWLSDQRFPRLSEAEQEFRTFCAGLRLPANVALTHALSFEQDKVDLVVSFRNREELARAWPRFAGVLREE